MFVEDLKSFLFVRSAMALNTVVCLNCKTNTSDVFLICHSCYKSYKLFPPSQEETTKMLDIIAKLVREDKLELTCENQSFNKLLI